MMRFVLSAGILAAMIGAADAAPKCSPGKIYRVSKKVCVDKTAAVREGIISNTRKKMKASADSKSARLAMLETRKAAHAQAARTTTGKVAETTPQQAVQQPEQAHIIILHPVMNVIGSTNAPFGALLDPWTSKSLSALPETRFSLRMTVED